MTPAEDRSLPAPAPCRADQAIGAMSHWLPQAFHGPERLPKALKWGVARPASARPQ